MAVLWGKNRVSSGTTVFPCGGHAGDLSDVVGVRCKKQWRGFLLRSA